jgi:demethylmenaquinone methyltransferase/2-methoxy-6-polyprenyl-1,4-benzoquinol methylase
MNNKLNPEQNWFGDKQVEPEEKTELVNNVFHSVAYKYDLMNDLMSAGKHRLWKNRFVRDIRPNNNHKILDVAGGTGDIAFRILKKAPSARITVYDYSQDMLTEGRKKAIDKGILDSITWSHGNAENLPFEDNSFDIYTISFGLRNVTKIDDALKEAYRVLKPGGKFYCLEFSHVQEPFLANAYDKFSFSFIPLLGQIVAKDRDSYQYLVESIRKFPDQNALLSRILSSGFEKATFSNLSFGVCAIHKAYKL